MNINEKRISVLIAVFGFLILSKITEDKLNALITTILGVLFLTYYCLLTLKK